jgi:osmotically-inducible protein OsmY
MSKTDAQLQLDVIDELRFDPRVGSAEIGVVTTSGVVTLTGQVDSYARKRDAVAAAERVGSVRSVVNEITVSLPASHKRTDTDLTHAVASTLKRNVQIPDERIKACAAGGWVWLVGNVEWQYQIDVADRAVRHITGVRGMSNLLRVERRASLPDVTQRIKRAIKRHAELEAKRIAVQAIDGRVTLRGTVRSCAERAEAERTAWSARGVTAVEDELLVRL